MHHLPDCCCKSDGEVAAREFALRETPSTTRNTHPVSVQIAGTGIWYKP